MTRFFTPLLLFFACLAASGAVGANETGQPAAKSSQSRIEKLEQEQEQLLRNLRKQLKGDSPEYEQARRLVLAIEREQQRPRKQFLSPRSEMTVEMRAYHARFRLKIEDCGTRNFPKRDGRSVYGSGIVKVTLDRKGNALSTDIEKSSGEPLLDTYMEKLVSASSPFGVPPEKATPAGAPYDLLVIIDSFNFTHNDDPVQPVKKTERCRWR